MAHQHILLYKILGGQKAHLPFSPLETLGEATVLPVQNLCTGIALFKKLNWFTLNCTGSFEMSRGQLWNSTIVIARVTNINIVL